MKYTVLVPLPDDSVNEGAVEYVCHVAPLKLDDSLAMYCVGLPEHVLFRVTLRLLVDEVPLLIANDVTTGPFGTFVTRIVYVPVELEEYARTFT